MAKDLLLRLDVYELYMNEWLVGERGYKYMHKIATNSTLLDLSGSYIHQETLASAGNVNFFLPKLE